MIQRWRHFVLFLAETTIFQTHCTVWANSIALTRMWTNQIDGSKKHKKEQEQNQLHNEVTFQYLRCTARKTRRSDDFLTVFEVTNGRFSWCGMFVTVCI